ncbi:hypothetical protein [Streptomyces griseus]|uniref:hypothetical protein n=1 Tax=Streptomyces griseus TaxID=1911 RepID=UPI00366092F9
MAAAEHRCHCTGACGNRHSKSGLHCDRSTRDAQMLVAPADLTLSPVAAAAVPVAELLAWCPGCHRKATARQRAADAERQREQPEPDSLF